LTTRQTTVTVLQMKAFTRLIAFTLLLGTLLVSPAGARADESGSGVQTGTSSTTLGGFVDSSGRWHPNAQTQRTLAGWWQTFVHWLRLRAN